MEPEAPPPITFDSLHKATERILTDYHDATTVLVERVTLLTDPERRNRAWRCHLQGTTESVPKTVIIKQVSPEGYDPANVEAWDTTRFFNDWAGAQFLSEVAPTERHGPTFYGGNIDLGFIVLEDLGEHTSLVKPLLEGDAASAHVALVALARRLGAMHASAMGKEAQYRAIRHNLSPEWVANGIKSPEAQQEAREKQASNFADSCRGLGIEVDEAAQQELLAALLRVDEPGPFLTFLHCDPCPDNDFYQDGELRLIDFEFSAFGHALRDGIYGRLPFPTCWCANTVPAATVREMEDAYRLELADVCPEIREDERFLEEATAVAASWTIGTVQWHLKEALEEDRTWGIAGTRARIFTRITMLLDTARSADQMPALCSVLEKALTELQSRWPEATPLPLYPAFRSDI